MTFCGCRKTNVLRAVTFALAALVAGSAFALEPPDETEGEKQELKREVRNPVRKVSGMMEKAGKLLHKLDTGDDTQEQQKKILEELDKLIRMAQNSSSSSSQSRQRKGSSSGSKQRPRNSGASTGSSPMPDERDVLRSVRKRPGEGAPDLREIWGKLPEAPREDIMQLLSEKLPMKYRQLLYLYFKALSEKK